MCAHGAHFEDAIERHVLHPRLDWPVFPIERQRCTQAMCLALGLPARLSAAADALELSNRKDAAGERLMHQTSKPRRAHKDEDPDHIYWLEDQDRLDRLYEYCRQDVEVERELYSRLPPLSRIGAISVGAEHTDQQRGFHVDRAFAEAARKIAEAAAPEIDAEIAEITAGDVTTISTSCQAAGMAAATQLHHGDAGPQDNREEAARARADATSPSGCWSFGWAGPRQRRRRSMPCLLVLAMMIASVVLSVITAPPRADGLVKEFSRKT